MNRFQKRNLTQTEISSADPTFVLSKLSNRGIRLYDIVQVDELTVRLLVAENDALFLKDEVIKLGGTFKIVEPATFHTWLQRLPCRSVLLIAILIILFLTALVPRHILFVKVVGNYDVPTNQIISCAEDVGIRFGCLRKDIRSEEIKNQLMSLIPQLQWVGVNTRGCVAEISVREKTDTETLEESGNAVSNIVADRDGIIISKTILEGTDVCDVGQAVLAGQLLVSGYTDCGIILQATDAQAEILAQTKRNCTVVFPIKYMKREELTDQTTRYSILIGKKLIKLYKGSGISGGSCAKIYERDYVQLPGGFCLPVSLITEHIYTYETQSSQRTDFEWLEDFPDSFLSSAMIAGRIIDSSEELTADEELVLLSGQYDCIEMIGRRMYEEKIDTYGVCN